MGVCTLCSSGSRVPRDPKVPADHTKLGTIALVAILYKSAQPRPVIGQSVRQTN